MAPGENIDINIAATGNPGEYRVTAAAEAAPNTSTEIKESCTVLP